MSASLLSGFDLFQRSNFDHPGGFYSAFFQLSTGLERLMKIVVILDHQAKNDLMPPTDKQLRSLGHSIVDCYTTCKSIATIRNQVLKHWFGSDDLEYKILIFLSDFARGALLQSRPVSRWKESR